MRTKILLAIVFAMMLVGAVDATTTTKLVFWMGSHYGEQSYTTFLPLQAHVIPHAGSSNNPAVNSVAFPLTGNFTALAAISNAPAGGCSPACTRSVFITINGSDSAAGCTITEGLQNCSWTGSVAVRAGDAITISFHATGSPAPDSPLDVMTVFTFSSGQRNWPFAS